MLVEVIVGFPAGVRPQFMDLFREAERRVQAHYPALCAEALGYLPVAADPDRLAAGERLLTAYLALAREGLAGVNLSTDPYDQEASPAVWATAARWAARAADAGLGVSAHAGEFSTANLAAALALPGLSRVGHATFAPHDPRLLDRLAASGVTVECSLSCNVILGSVPSYTAHPFRQFLARGIPLALGTDNPVRFHTTIDREYGLAAALGCADADLLGFTRAAIQASFTTLERRARLLADLDAWEAPRPGGGRA
jgi:adenosine deaminase